MTALPRVVVVHRRTELESLLERHGTRGQVEFFLAGRGRALADVQARHDRLQQALRGVRGAVPPQWRVGDVERDDLHRFGFEPQDVCVVVGQDGLVANVAKYLGDQPVIGVDPEPGEGLRVLVRHRSDAVAALLTGAVAGTASVQRRAMVRAVLDDGQKLDALNEVYLGDHGHQSARYRLRAPGATATERQSSSGLIVATGTGATGWAASLARRRTPPPPLPSPELPNPELPNPQLPSADQRWLAWFVREAWPSPTTGTDLVQGALGPDDELTVVVESDALVVFGDGLESDRLTATWGQQVTITLSPRTMHLVDVGQQRR
jgi:hypothetical protein